MKDIKFQILHKLYHSPTHIESRKSLYDICPDNPVKVKQALENLTEADFIEFQAGYDTYRLTLNGVLAYEVQQDRNRAEEECKREANDLKRERIFTRAIAILALLISLASLLLDIFGRC